MGALSQRLVFRLIFSVGLLCDKKLLFFISKCGNLLVLRSTGLVCSGDPQSGEHSAFLAQGLGDGTESSTLSLHMGKILQRGKLEDTRFTQQVAETHPFHLPLAHIQNAPRINCLGTTIPLPPFYPVLKSLSQARRREELPQGHTGSLQ